MYLLGTNQQAIEESVGSQGSISDLESVGSQESFDDQQSTVVESVQNISDEKNFNSEVMFLKNRFFHLKSLTEISLFTAEELQQIQDIVQRYEPDEPFDMESMFIMPKPVKKEIVCSDENGSVVNMDDLNSIVAETVSDSQELRRNDNENGLHQLNVVEYSSAVQIESGQ